MVIYMACIVEREMYSRETCHKRIQTAYGIQKKGTCKRTTRCARMQYSCMCQCCNSLFIAKLARAHFCSKDCRSLHQSRSRQRSIEPRMCQRCGSEFLARKDTKTKCCGHSCATKLQKHINSSKEASQAA